MWFILFSFVKIRKIPTYLQCKIVTSFRHINFMMVYNVSWWLKWRKWWYRNIYMRFFWLLFVLLILICICESFCVRIAVMMNFKKIRFKCIPIQNAYHEVAKWNYALLPYQSTDFVIPFILTNTKHGSKMHSEITMHIQYAHQICPRLLYKSVFFAKFISGLLMNLQNAKLLLSFI